MTAYYNEFDPQAAEWLRILILQGNIAPGFVDERSITEVDPDELRQYTQCHFFAGIGGWSYALRLAGWADDRPCWTGSPPCQPFSNAGKRNAQADARHLWPVFFNLIRECRPANIFGEQVEAAIRTGWLDDLQDDLEAEGYATGKIVLPACSVGGYHIRQRIWFVAERVGDTIDKGLERHAGNGNGSDQPGRLDQKSSRSAPEAGTACKFCGHKFDIDLPGKYGCPNCEGGGLAEPDCERHVGVNALLLGQEPGRESQDCVEIAGGCEASRMADTAGDRCQRQGQRWPAEEGREPQPESARKLPAGLERSSDDSTTDAPDSIWRNPDWLFCRDGKWRPVESSVLGIFNGLPDELVRSCNISPACNPLAKDQEARTMRLKGYGNAIVPPLAAEAIRAYMEGKHETTD